jgi:hypothetical protein
MLHVHVPYLRAAGVPPTANVDHACQHAGTCLNQGSGQGGHVQAGQASHLEKTVSSQSRSAKRGTPHCKDNPIYVILFWKLLGLSPKIHIHLSVSDLYIPRISPHISLQQNRSWK